MKKTNLILTMLFFLGTTFATAQRDKEFDRQLDSLCYAFGYAQTQGIKDYLSQNMDVDLKYMDDFIKGVLEAANTGNDKRKNAFCAGVQIGQQISQQMVQGINDELFDGDSTQTINLKQFVAGFVAGLREDTSVMGAEKAQQVSTELLPKLKTQYMEGKYGEWKAKNEEAFKELIRKGGYSTLEGGSLYKVLRKGTGAIPTTNDRVKVNYEGSLIDGTVFDSSYERNETMTFRCDQVIPGFSAALTHMPVGSKWEVYIPADQAYKERNAGKIKPFSMLKFVIELLSIEK